jgi:hypothetical protein
MRVHEGVTLGAQTPVYTLSCIRAYILEGPLAVGTLRFSVVRYVRFGSIGGTYLTRWGLETPLSNFCGESITAHRVMGT